MKSNNVPSQMETNRKELNQILDDALDEFSSDDEVDTTTRRSQSSKMPSSTNPSSSSNSSTESKKPTTTRTTTTNATASAATATATATATKSATESSLKQEEVLAASLEDMMKSFMEMSNPTTHSQSNNDSNISLEQQQQQVDQLFQQMMQAQMNNINGNENSDNTTTTGTTGTTTRSDQMIPETDATVAKILNDMAKAESLSPNRKTKDDGDGDDDVDVVGGLDPKQLEAMGEDIMQSMMEELQQHASKEDGGFVDGMMQQLLAKDIMYEPMKSVCDEFPHWLAKHKSKLNEDEYQRYGQQYQGFQRIVHVYEHDPENYPKLMELMQDIQEFGQPPAEIVQKLAPDLEFDPEGMPNNIDPNVMMNGGLPGAPLGNEQCPVM